MNDIVVLLWCLALAISLFGAFWLLIVWASVSAEKSLKKTLERLSQTPCLFCGEKLGMASILSAQGEYHRYVQELREKHPGARFRLSMNLHISCPTCGGRMVFTKSDGLRKDEGD